MGRHGRRAAIVAAICALTTVFAVQSALAAPEVGDAGDLPLTAQEPGPAGALTSIEGMVAGSEDADMYKVCLTGGADFSASTIGGAGFDTQLFLFDEQGMGLYANDDASGSLQSELPAGNALGPTAPGVHYLAIAAFDWDPQSAPGLEGFIFASSSGVVGPTGHGGGEPITGWASRQKRPGGSYAIALTGTRSCVDATPPTVDLRTPADGAVYAQGAEVLADYDCADEDHGSGLATCVGDLPDGAPIDTVTPGDHTFTVHATDAAGNASTRSATYRVEEPFRFDFEGFFWPVVNRPRVNVVKAGRVVPIRFSLDGHRGRDPIASGYPRSREVPCGSGEDVDGGEPTRSAGRWRLRYKRRRDLYVYLWKTDRDWAGDCRQFILKLDDGSYQRADFRFVGKRHHWRDDSDD